MAAETEVETVLNLEKEAQTVSEDAEVKADGVEDENGFVIDENGVLTDYKGSGGDIVIPEGVTSIGWGAFDGCSNLTSITIPEGVTSIGESAFCGCSNLTIICQKDSHAEKYAKENNIKYQYIGGTEEQPTNPEQPTTPKQPEDQDRR